MSEVSADTAPAYQRAKEASASDIRGLLDNATTDRLYGWAFDAAHPGARLQVELRVAGSTVATTIADLPRPDLAQNGIGDGCHAFEFPLTQDLLERRAELSLAVIGGDGRELPIPVRLHMPEPDLPSTVRSLAGEQRRLREATQALGKQLEQLPDYSLLQQAITQQAELGERLGALELWLARLDRRLAELPESTPPRQSRLDPWQFGLFAVLLLALLAALGATFALRAG